MKGSQKSLILCNVFLIRERVARKLPEQFNMELGLMVLNLNFGIEQANRRVTPS